MTATTSNDDIFSDGYLDQFYKTHVATSRRTSIDEDIAAIEAEINKVHEYRHKFRGYRVMEPSQAQQQQGDQLNSCGNSVCSDDEETSDTSLDMEMLPTSVFRIYNSTCMTFPCSNNNNNVFSWAEYQLVSHDHTYSSSSPLTDSLYLVQDSLTLYHIKWNTLSVNKRTQTLKRLASILHNKPTSIPSLLSPSLFYLPQPMADLLRSNNGLVPSVKGSALPGVDKDVVIKLSRDSLAQSLITAATSLKNKKKTRSTPYERPSKQAQPLEITRVRYSCSESETPLEVD